MGEAKRRNILSTKVLLSPAGSDGFVETPSGKVHINWDSKSSVTPFGQMAYFIEFLNMTGLFSGWVNSCPLEYTSPNAPCKLDFLGTVSIRIENFTPMCVQKFTPPRAPDCLVMSAGMLS
jgi:hypothetical protein